MVLLDHCLIFHFQNHSCTNLKLSWFDNPILHPFEVTNNLCPANFARLGAMLVAMMRARYCYLSGTVSKFNLKQSGKMGLST